MEYLLVIPILVLGALLWWEKLDRRLERGEYAIERAQLLNRIQHPEVLPPLEYAEEEPVKDETRLMVPDDLEYDKVGTIEEGDRG